MKAYPRGPQSDRRQDGSRQAGFDTEIVGVVKDSHYAGRQAGSAARSITLRGGRTSGSTGSISTCVRRLPADQMFQQVRRVMRSDRSGPAARKSAHARRAGPPQHPERRDRAATGGGVRDPRDGAGDARAVRRDGAQRDAADARDRDSHRARRRAGAHPGDGAAGDVWILGIGLVAGVPAALAYRSLTASQLYGVKAARRRGGRGGRVGAGGDGGPRPRTCRRGGRRSVNPLNALRYE